MSTTTNKNNASKNNATKNNANKNNAPKNNPKSVSLADFDLNTSTMNENLLNNINKRVGNDMNPEAKETQNAAKQREQIRDDFKELGQDIKSTFDDAGKNIKQGFTKTTKTLQDTFDPKAIKSKLNLDNNENKKKASNNNTKTEKLSIMAVVLQFVKVLLLVGVLIGLLYVIYYLFVKYKKQGDMVTLLDKPKDGETPMVISQDDNNSNLKINKSNNQPGGIEFTYSFWIVISSLEKRGEWKHLFHKGNRSSYPNRAPGVWLHPNKNDLRIYLNTPDDPLAYLDVEEIPLKKWVNITMTYSQINKNNNNNVDSKNVNILDVYVNGLLKKTKSFDQKVQLNEGDLWINMFGGFKGYIAGLKYLNKKASITQIQNLVDSCPNISSCGIDADCPPYLDIDYWFK